MHPLGTFLYYENFIVLSGHSASFAVASTRINRHLNAWQFVLIIDNVHMKKRREKAAERPHATPRHTVWDLYPVYLTCQTIICFGCFWLSSCLKGEIQRTLEQHTLSFNGCPVYLLRTLILYSTVNLMRKSCFCSFIPRSDVQHLRLKSFWAARLTTFVGTAYSRKVWAM